VWISRQPIASTDEGDDRPLSSRVGERSSAEIARVMASYFRARDDMEAVSREELLDRLRCGAVTLIDVRPEDEFAAGHLPYARSLPLAELKKRLSELPKNKPVVAYCRGPFCMMAKDAVVLLHKRGYKASKLDDGVAEWRARGLPIAQ